MSVSQEQVTEVFGNNGRLTFGFLDAIDEELEADLQILMPVGSPSLGVQETVTELNEEAKMLFLVLLKVDIPRISAKFPDANERLRFFISLNRCLGVVAGWSNRDIIFDPSFHSRATCSPDEFSKATKMSKSLWSLVAFMSGQNFFSSGNLLGGEKLSKSSMRILSDKLEVPATRENETSKMFLAAARPYDTRTLVYLISREGSKVYHDTLHSPFVAHFPVVRPGKDAWANVRQLTVPASLRIVSVFLTMHTSLVSLNLDGIPPVPEAAQVVTRIMTTFSQGLHRGHPNSRTLFGVDTVAAENLQVVRNAVAEIGSFFVVSNRLKTLTQAPHIAKIIAENESQAWANRARRLSRPELADNEVTDILIKSATGAALEHDPRTNLSGYLSAVNVIRSELKAAEEALREEINSMNGNSGNNSSGPNDPNDGSAGNLESGPFVHVRPSSPASSDDNDPMDGARNAGPISRFLRNRGDESDVDEPPMSRSRFE